MSAFGKQSKNEGAAFFSGYQGHSLIENYVNLIFCSSCGEGSSCSWAPWQEAVPSRTRLCPPGLACCASVTPPQSTVLVSGAAETRNKQTNKKQLFYYCLSHFFSDRQASVRSTFPAFFFSFPSSQSDICLCLPCPSN